MIGQLKCSGKKTSEKYIGVKNTRRKQQKILEIYLKVINQKILAKKGSRKLYRDRLFNKKKVFPNNEREFWKQVGGECAKKIQQINSKEANQFWSKIWEAKEQKRHIYLWLFKVWSHILKKRSISILYAAGYLQKDGKNAEAE